MKKKIIYVISFLIIAVMSLEGYFLIKTADKLNKTNAELLEVIGQSTELNMALLTSHFKLSELEKQLGMATINCTNFSSEEEVIKWFVDYARGNYKELSKVKGGLYCMTIQAQAIKDKHLASVNVGGGDYILPIVFTPYHTYALILVADDTEIWVCQVDGGRGWYIGDFSDWVIMKYYLYSEGYVPFEILDW